MGLLLAATFHCLLYEGCLLTLFIAAIVTNQIADFFAVPIKDDRQDKQYSNDHEDYQPVNRSKFAHLKPPPFRGWILSGLAWGVN